MSSAQAFSFAESGSARRSYACRMREWATYIGETRATITRVGDLFVNDPGNSAGSQYNASLTG